MARSVPPLPKHEASALDFTTYSFSELVELKGTIEAKYRRAGRRKLMSCEIR